MTNNTSKIPHCRSSWLQDVTIALGQRSLKSQRQSNKTLAFEVAEENIEGISVERLNIEARTFSGRLTKIVLWADGNSWFYCCEQIRNTPSRPILEIHADLANMNIDGVADLLRATLADPLAVEGKWKERAITTRVR